jgi:hypothetical protein
VIRFEREEGEGGNKGREKGKGGMQKGRRKVVK